MTILTKCFQYLYKDKNDSSWSTKYYNQHNEEELLRKISQLEDVYQTEHHNSSKLSHVRFYLKHKTKFMKLLNVEKDLKLNLLSSMEEI